MPDHTSATALLLTGSKYVFEAQDALFPGASAEVVEVNNVGLVLVNDGPLPAYDRSIAALVHGLEERLLSHNIRVMTRLVPSSRDERAAYRRWSRDGVVDAVVLMDVRGGDRRVPLLRELGMPFVGVTDRSRVGEFSTVTLDTRAMVTTVLRFLAERGYERAVYVRVPGGPTSELGALRASMFTAESAVGIDVDVVLADPSTIDSVVPAIEAAGGSRAAVVLDDDTSAIAAMALMQAAGRRIPDDVAVFAWNDSPLCQTADPAISALNARTDVIGDLVGDCLLRSVDVDHPVHLAAPTPFVVARASA